jgi:hypothetical protein
MQHSTRPARSDQKPANNGTGGVREGVLMVGGVAAVAACCLGGALLLAVGGGVIASIVFGPWGLGVALAGVAGWGVGRYRRWRACVAKPAQSSEEKHHG